VTHEDPKVAVCSGSYVFDATPEGGGRFDPAAPCPAYTVAPQIQTAVAAKERADAQTFAALVRAGTPIAAAYIPQDGRLRRTLNEPVHMDRFGNLPTMTASVPATAAPVAAAQPATATAGTRVAAAHAAAPAAAPAGEPAAPAASNAGGMLAWVGGSQATAAAPAAQSKPFYTRLFHLGSSQPAETAPQPVPAAAAVPLPVPKPAKHYRRTASVR
jgi:hypothetical protein